MKFMLLVYTDRAPLEGLPPRQADEMMRGGLAHADELRRDGHLLQSQMLEEPSTAKSVHTEG